MSNEKFALGIDYGTESGRVVVIRVRNGEEIASAVIPYPDGVIDEKLPGGPRLGPDWALQNPKDYLLVIEKGVPKTLKAAAVMGEARTGSFTATVLTTGEVLVVGGSDASGAVLKTAELYHP